MKIYNNPASTSQEDEIQEEICYDYIGGNNKEDDNYEEEVEPESQSEYYEAGGYLAKSMPAHISHSFKAQTPKPQEKLYPIKSKNQNNMVINQSLNLDAI